MGVGVVRTEGTAAAALTEVPDTLEGIIIAKKFLLPMLK